jgi:hypothetical protein
MNLIELIRDFIPQLVDIYDEDLEKFDKLAYALVECDTFVICFASEPTELIYDWFGVDGGSLYELFNCNVKGNVAQMIKLGKELGSATAVELQRREWEANNA